MHTPSPGSYRRPSQQFQWQEALTTGTSACPSPSPRSYRRASKVVEETSAALQSPTNCIQSPTSFPGGPLTLTNNGHVGNNNHHATGLDASSSEDESSQVAL